MEVGLRTTGKPVELPPMPIATALRFYSTELSFSNFYNAGERSCREQRSDFRELRVRGQSATKIGG
jgi:hypothetical protein